MNRQEYFHDLEHRLNALVASIGHLLPETDRHQAQEFIEVGEYGLALEALTHFFAAGSIGLPHTAFKSIQAIAEIMGMEAEVITDGLRNKVK